MFGWPLGPDAKSLAAGGWAPESDDVGCTVLDNDGSTASRMSLRHACTVSEAVLRISPDLTLYTVASMFLAEMLLWSELQMLMFRLNLHLDML